LVILFWFGQGRNHRRRLPDTFRGIEDRQHHLEDIDWSGRSRAAWWGNLVVITGLTFNSAGNLFVAHFSSGTIYEFTPGGAQSAFASGLGGSTFLAFQGVTLPVPEPPAFGLLAVGMFGITLLRRHQP
jgi:hypothetical protein